MKNLIIFLLLFFSVFSSYSQLRKEKEGYYLEDQIYFKFSYNVLSKLSKSIHQSGFSNGISIGFIRDLPINKRRNFGFGIGLGYGLDTYFHNLKISQINNETTFENFGSDENYNSNKLKLHQIEIPFEIRWRTSTVDKYKFWRIYSGVKAKYVFFSKSVYDLNGRNVYKNLKAIDKLQYGLTIAAGYGTFNFFMYYGLSPIFKNATFKGNDLQIKELQFGLQFYIL